MGACALEGVQLPTKVTGCLSFTLVTCHNKVVGHVEPPDCCIIHYGKREVLSRINAMEQEYEQILSWEEPGPTVPGAAATEPNKPWGDRIVVSRPSQSLRERQTASLMADSYGFQSQEELLRVQKYLRDHGGWQLEQVSHQPKQAWSLAIHIHAISWSFE